MTIALRDIDVALDEGASAFVTEFMSNVTTLVGYQENRLETVHRVKGLLLHALADAKTSGETKWQALHHAVDRLMDPVAAVRHPRAAAYLLAFLRENGDLA